MSEQQSAREHHRGIAQRLASNLAGLAHNHLSLFGLELQDEKERLIKVLMLVLVGAFVVWLGLAVLSVALVWWVAAEWRWAALLGVAAVYLAGGAFSLYVAWQTVTMAAHPFAGTLDELRKDREQFLP